MLPLNISGLEKERQKVKTDHEPSRKLIWDQLKVLSALKAAAVLFKFTGETTTAIHAAGIIRPSLPLDFVKENGRVPDRHERLGIRCKRKVSS